MQLISSRLAKRLAVAVALSTLTSAAAHAQDFAGYTFGCFDGAPNAACSPTGPNASIAPGATFTGVGSLATPTAFGTAVGGNLTLTNLGTLTVARQRGGATYDDSFTLGVFFTQPGGSGNFLSSVTGTLNNGGNGSILFNFGGPQLITFDGGSFTLQIDDATAQVAGNSANGTVQITGSITNFMMDPVATVPEPSTVALLGAGIAALVVVRRRRNA